MSFILFKFLIIVVIGRYYWEYIFNLVIEFCYSLRIVFRYGYFRMSGNWFEGVRVGVCFYLNLSCLILEFILLVDLFVFVFLV